MPDFAVAVAWHDREQIDKFLEAWKIENPCPPWLFLEQDKNREGGSKTKNRAMRRAVNSGAKTVICLDDDCYPAHGDLESFCLEHDAALDPQPVEMFEVVTNPPSRGTPYRERNMTMPVAASMGFWLEVGDYCAVRQLVHYGQPMTFRRKTVFGRYFPLCGMNYAFRPAQWNPWFYLVENVGRFDDIWMGWMWQREAYARGCCFNLQGPLVRHARQSNVWRNLEDEVRHLERNETLWREIATATYDGYDSLAKILPRNS